MYVTKPYKSIGFEAMDVTKPCKIIGFGVMDVSKPYKSIGFGDNVDEIRRKRQYTYSQEARWTEEIQLGRPLSLHASQSLYQPQPGLIGASRAKTKINNHRIRAGIGPKPTISLGKW